ncbi:MAG TPA: molybdopterin-dependent oxidoreductase, partial [Thermomicrobiales bacterium]|nr:molybdopterin-dependent oxidoreductase [Thermomicrobiales bacterium]
ALLVLLVPKAGIIARALRGRRPARGRATLAVSLGLLGLTAVVVAAALGWSLARGPWSGAWGLPLLVVHWYAGIGLLPLLALHVRKHWRRPRRADFAGRRRVLALGAGALLAAIAWWAVEAGAGAATARAGRRRFTGSREADYGAPNAFFVTQFLNDDPAPLAPDGWRLRVTGNVARPLTLRYADLRAAASLTATVDCTGGVYATRTWSGLPAAVVLDVAQASPQATLVWFVSATGYRWPLPLDEARRALLATHVGGEPLSHDHGSPLRLVAPERRGFQWIKWLTEIRVQ